MITGQHLGIGSTKPIFPDDGLLHLYSMRFCPYAHRVHLVLDAKNIPHHTININLREKPDWFVNNVSTTGKVPVLELPTESGTPTLVESLIICDYLDEKYPQRPLYSRDPLRRAQDRILIQRFSQFIDDIYKLLLPNSPTELGTTDLYAGLDIYEKELNLRETAYFGGEAPGMLDYMIWPWCERFPALKYELGFEIVLDPKRFGNLLRWRDLMLDDTPVKKSYLDGETHAKYMRSRRAGETEYDML
ncbi:pyrimidodiazepine synthase isoform X2 [Scaptodrosophila lebanonensis]|nr:pyrimidodiazepine synthase isoform X2 [Scaptodrosophila lebanonensis]